MSFMKILSCGLLLAALLSGPTATVSAQTKAKTSAKTVGASAGKKDGKGRGKRGRMIAHWESVMGRKLTEAQKTQLRSAAEERDAANKKFRNTVARLFATTPEALSTREKAYRQAQAAKPKPKR
jgi:hypothetical protein